MEGRGIGMHLSMAFEGRGIRSGDRRPGYWVWFLLTGCRNYTGYGRLGPAHFLHAGKTSKKA